MNSSTIVSTLKTSDKDLVQLAGYHAYKYYKEGHVETINGKDFEVMDIVRDTKTGLDAMTVENQGTGELSVVYVGSDQLVGDWFGTNAQLPSYVKPAQIEAAKQYFDDMSDQIGEISSVTGNSLAGANANAVGIENPDVKVVTINPAMLPGGMIDPTKEYANITNYYSEYDVLTRSQETLGYGDRIPGNVYKINNGVSKFTEIIANHKGYPEDKIEGEFKVMIGKEGEVGHGYIHVGADSHIVTSIWTGIPLYGGSSTIIKINGYSLNQLATGIEKDVKGRLEMASDYLGNSISIVHDESAKFNQRLSNLQEKFQLMFESTAGEPMFKGITTTGYMIKSCIDALISLLNIAEEKCRFLNVVLNSKPAEVIEYITSTDISVESLFAPTRNYLRSLRYNVDELVFEAQDIIRKDIPKIFNSGTSTFIDAVVGELDAHYSIIQKNKGKMDGQLINYEKQIRFIAEAFNNVDNSSAEAIKTNSGFIKVMETEQNMVTVSLEESSYLKDEISLKEVHVNLVHAELKGKSMKVMVPLLFVIRGLLRSIEGTLEATIFAMKSSVNITLYGNPVSLVRSLFTDYDQRVKAAAKEARQPIEDMEEVLEGLRIAIDRLIAGLPEMLDDFKVYIDTAIFAPSKYSNVRLYNIAALAILDEMDLLFNDITLQLANEKGKAIDVSLEISQSVLKNIQVLKEQVDRGTRL